ncbi:AAA family ATPase [Adlercreutzia sp. ZJ304]|uniref:ATP-binding protein n=1 Tax=Adlercreutzia sp. ZJ304 TaxID=2709791 RepID=UPI0013EBC511|nr:AAA family ATPase [Adlercreutzia sp. ZJ304]
MLKRKVYQQLIDWKSSQQRKRKALLVTGARQIGKSYIIRHFGMMQYKALIEINLLEDRAAQQSLSRATDTQDFINRLMLIARTEPVDGSTLIFIDEIQESPDIMTYAKFLVEDGRFDYAFSGSMLGAAFKGVRSFPVGFVTEIEMRPLDFEEFCWATLPTTSPLDATRQAFLDQKPLEKYIHDTLIAAFRSYVIVGGMPEIVQQFADVGTLEHIRPLQLELNRQYAYDISRYAGRRALQVQAIFDELPVQLEEMNVKFAVTSLDKTARYDRFEQDFIWITRAGVGLKVNRVTEPRPPLRRTQKASNFKLYQSDTGMLVARFSQSLARAIYEDSRTVNMGGVFENVIAQELVAAQFEPYYFMSRKAGEVDFLIEGENGIVALEVKSGRDYLTHASLAKAMHAPGYEIDRGIVLCRSNFEVRDGILYAPWYASICFSQL